MRLIPCLLESLQGFQCSFSTISDNSELQLAPSIKSCILSCQVRVPFVPVPQAGKMSASILSHYFPSHPAVFGLQVSSPSNNIMLNPAIKKAMVWLFMPLQKQGSLFIIPELALLILLPLCRVLMKGSFKFQKCMDYLLRFMKFWRVFVSQWVCNTAHSLANLFNSVSRQCHEVWALQFPFLHNFKDTIPPTEACLYVCINLSLVQTQQQSALC